MVKDGNLEIQEVEQILNNFNAHLQFANNAQCKFLIRNNESQKKVTHFSSTEKMFYSVKTYSKNEGESKLLR